MGNHAIAQFPNEASETPPTTTEQEEEVARLAETLETLVTDFQQVRETAKQFLQQLDEHTRNLTRIERTLNEKFPVVEVRLVRLGRPARRRRGLLGNRARGRRGVLANRRVFAFVALLGGFALAMTMALRPCW